MIVFFLKEKNEMQKLSWKKYYLYRNNEDYSVYKQIIKRQSIKKIEKKTNRFQCFWLKNLIIIQFKYILWNLKFAKIL